jgi:4a-hydroxytetrahydrobiopterin dehydratase
MMPKPLKAAEIKQHLKLLSGWSLKKNALEKAFDFKDYYEAMAFVNATAWISHAANHHPDIELGYNKVKMRYSTHSAGGITASDFACAAKVEKLFSA